MITTARGVSVALPVSGSTALMSNWFWPRRRSTWSSTRRSERPSRGTAGPGPATSTVTVAPGSTCPQAVRRRVSSTSKTAVAGFVTASRRLREAQQLDAEVDEEQDDADGQERGHDDGRREGQAGAAPRAAAGGDDRLAAPSPRRARGATGGGRPRGRARGRSRSCAGSPSCRPRPAGRGSRRARGAEVAGPDLRVALGPEEVDALALARGGEPVRQGRARGRAASRALAGVRARPGASAARARRASSCVVLVLRRRARAASSRRRTTRAFEPSNAPM